MGRVVDRTGQLAALGSVFGPFGLLRWLRDFLPDAQGAGAGSLDKEFRDFVGGPSNGSAVLTLQLTAEGSGRGPARGGQVRAVEELPARGSRGMVPKNGAEARGGGAEEN